MKKTLAVLATVIIGASDSLVAKVAACELPYLLATPTFGFAEPFLCVPLLRGHNQRSPAKACVGQPYMPVRQSSRRRTGRWAQR